MSGKSDKGVFLPNMLLFMTNPEVAPKIEMRYTYETSVSPHASVIDNNYTDVSPQLALRARGKVGTPELMRGREPVTGDDALWCNSRTISSIGFYWVPLTISVPVLARTHTIYPYDNRYRRPAPSTCASVVEKTNRPESPPTRPHTSILCDQIIVPI